MSLQRELLESLSSHAASAAVITEDNNFTYETLQRSISEVTMRVQGECCVGICVDEGYELVVGMVGCWLNGVPFVCLDRRWPRNRREKVAAACGVTVLLLDNNEWEPFPVVGTERVTTNASYFTSTSGTTGEPKIVCTSSQCLYESARGKISEENISNDSVVLLASHFTFDPCQVDVAATIMQGGAIYAPRRASVTSWRFKELLQSVTHVCCTPTHWKLVGVETTPRDFPNLQCVTLGGEPFPRILQTSPWCSSHIVFRNTYGLTEGTGYQTSHIITSAMSYAPIGAGFGSYTVRLDGGEIVIEGPGLSRYLDESSFSVLRTGDLGEETPEGLVVTGRKDGRVKVNGQRVSLEDVEAVVLSSRFISGAVGSLTHGQIGIWATPVKNLNLTHDLVATAVEAFCQTVLPPYAVPRMVGVGEQVTGDGKVDRAHHAALVRAQHEDRVQSRSIIPPVTPLDVLTLEAVSFAVSVPVERLGMGHNFLHFGGDSLSALRVVNSIRKLTTLSNPQNYPPVTAFEGVASMLVLTEQPEESVCELADVMGPYAPCELLARPVLSEYVAYLQISGVVPKSPTETHCGGPVRRTPPCDRDLLMLQCARKGVTRVIEAFGDECETVEGGEWGLLHEAVAHGQNRASKLLAKGKPACYLSTACHVAAARGNADLLLFLIESGADANAVDSDGQSIVHLAARSGDANTLRTAISHAGHHTTTPDAEGVTPLQWAVRNNHQDLQTILDTSTREADEEESFGRVKRKGPRSEHSVANRKVKKDSEVVQKLLEKLRDETDEKEKLETVTVIRSMCCAVKSHRLAFVEMGLVEVLNGMLLPPGKLSAQAAGTLRNLSSDMSTRRRMLATGSIPPLVRLLDLGPSSESCWRAAAALGGISASRETWPLLLSTGAARRITDMGGRKLGLPEALVEQL